jgi:hypothetical protein
MVTDTVAVTQNFANKQNLKFALEDILGNDYLEGFDALRSELCAKTPELELVFEGVKQRYEEDEKQVTVIRYCN